MRLSLWRMKVFGEVMSTTMAAIVAATTLRGRRAAANVASTTTATICHCRIERCRRRRNHFRRLRTVGWAAAAAAAAWRLRLILANEDGVLAFERLQVNPRFLGHRRWRRIY